MKTMKILLLSVLLFCFFCIPDVFGGIIFKAAIMNMDKSPLSTGYARLSVAGKTISASAGITRGSVTLDLGISTGSAFSGTLKLELFTDEKMRTKLLIMGRTNVPELMFKFEYKPVKTPPVYYLSGTGEVVTSASNAKPIVVVTDGTEIKAPLISPAGGIYTTVQTITITTKDIGYMIKYTTDGTNPAERNGQVYNAPITVASSMTIKAVTTPIGSWSPSPIASETYTITGRVDKPVINPNGGRFDSIPQNISMSTTTAGGTIKYTTDSSIPSRTNGTIYSTPFQVTTQTTIKVFAYKENWDDSEIASATIYFDLGAAQPPVFSPSGGIHNIELQVSFSCATPNANYVYTKDGSNPVTNSGSYIYSETGPIVVDKSMTITACAFSPDYSNSQTVKETYRLKVVNPYLKQPGGTYSSPVVTTMHCQTLKAEIWYTTDGSIPAFKKGNKYDGGKLTFNATTTIKMVGVRSGWEDSEVITITYTIQ